MKKKMKTTLLSLLLVITSSCGNDVGEYYFSNSGFELGSLDNWEVISGNAFTLNAIDVSSYENKTWNVVGDFFLNGERNGNSAVGVIKSPSFKLKGNGKIGFMLGGGIDTNKCYLVLCDTSTNEELKYIANYKFDRDNPSNVMHRVILDANEFVGKDVYIKIVDNDNSDTGYNYLIIDDFIVNYKGEADKVGAAYDATRYIENHRHEVVDTYRHSYHLMAPMGWINDPNGFSVFDGKIHLFYQHTPYSVGWDTMHWGHATSTDFVKWEDQPVALAPDKKYDRNGCFSGSAIEIDGRLYLLYAAVGTDGKQRQALAYSENGIDFTKLNRNPVISDTLLPNNATDYDFRDPKVFKQGSYYYAIIGSKLAGKQGGQLLLYRSNNLIDNWEYVGILFQSEITGGGIFECPDYQIIDGKDVIISSPQFLTSKEISEYQNIHSVTYQIGSLNLDSGAFTNDSGEMVMEEFDKGFDFYAAQCLKPGDGRTILTAWMNMWSRSSFPSSGHGWTGAMVLPRELTMKDNHIYQSPVREIEKYRKNKVSVSNKTISNESIAIKNIEGTKAEIEFTMDISSLSSDGKAGISVFKGTDNHTDIYYDAYYQRLVFNRINNGKTINGTGESGQNGVRYAPVTPIDGKIKLRLFLDVSSVEVFINDGYYTMTGTVFPDKDDTNIEFFVEDGSAIFSDITKYDLKVE